MNRPKELFEELGYSVDQDDEYCISYARKNHHAEIVFYYEDLKVAVLPVQISMPLLQAIYRQCEDLEWI